MKTYGSSLLLFIRDNENSSGKNSIKFLYVWTIVLIIICFPIAVLPLLWPSHLPLAKAIVNDYSITFTGSYGVTVPFESITRVELLQQVPSITSKIEGGAIADFFRGYFRLNEFGVCRLLLVKRPPYLYIEQTNGEKIIFNSRDSIYTKDVFAKLLELLE